MALVCCISGLTPEDPVVCPAGYVYERRLLVEQIELKGKSPVSGCNLEISDLKRLKKSTIVKPRPLNASSVPGLLSLFQNEWDSLMQETFTLKEHVQTVRQQLSYALYQHDAATRVIARLNKEKAEGELKITELTNRLSGMVAKSGVRDIGISEEIIAQMLDKSKELLAKRKKRDLTAYPSAEEFQSLECTGEYPIHSSATPGILTSFVDAKNSHIVTGGEDGNVVAFNWQTGKTVAKMPGHLKRVNAVAAHSSFQIVISGSDDKTIRVWKGMDENMIHRVEESRSEGKDEGSENEDSFKHKGKYTCSQILRKHNDTVYALSFHPLDNYFASSSADKTWCVYELDSGRCLRSSKTEDKYPCMSFHPDGMILGSGGTNGAVHIWDLRAASYKAALVEHTKTVNSLSFSENGYYMASTSEDGTLKLWDLRKSLAFQTIEISSLKGGEKGTNHDIGNYVAFDMSGKYLALAHQGLSIFNFEARTSVVETFSVKAHSQPLTSANFLPLSRGLVTVAYDRVLKIWQNPHQSHKKQKT